jgi:hypothetical protein
MLVSHVANEEPCIFSQDGLGTYRMGKGILNYLEFALQESKQQANGFIRNYAMHSNT